MSPQLDGVNQQNVILHDLSARQTLNNGVSPQPPIEAKSFEKAEQDFEPIPSQKLESAISRLNEEMSKSQRALRFSLDTETEKIILQVIDRKTDSVIREIPNNELPRFTDNTGDMIGLILDEQG